MLGDFELLEPATVAEASAGLAQYGDEASLYAGGTELLLLMKSGLRHYPVLINVKTIPGLEAIAFRGDLDALEIGALATHRQVQRSPLVAQHAPLLAEVEAHVANVRVRAAGTLGGNLCFAEPHSDPATLLVAWDASLVLQDQAGQREIAARDFFTGILETARRPEEVLTAVRLPRLPAGTGAAYARMALHERPTATIAALVRLEHGAIAEARLAIGSVGPAPMRATAAEAGLRGARPGEQAFAEAARLAGQAADVFDDFYGAADYKRHLVTVLAARALRQAAQRAGEGGHVH
jgi:carbon-monoxide dehydrogenase medium subunit